MKSFREQIGNVNKINTLGRIGAITFGKVLSDKNFIRTPHYEMVKAYDLALNVGFLNSGAEMMVLFVKPKKARFESTDLKSETFLNKWLDKRPKIQMEMEKSVFNAYVAGNVYLEPLKKRTVNGELILDNIANYNDASRIYLAKDGKSWILELPTFVTADVEYRGTVYRPTLLNVYYQIGATYPYKRIWGIRLKPEVFEHFKFGFSLDPNYGRGFFASVIDSGNVFRKIESNWDTISETRALNQKIVQFGDANNMIDLDDDQLEVLEAKLSQADKSYLAFNIPVEVKDKDIASVGNYDSMDAQIDFLRRDMSVLPQYLTPWADSSTTMGARETRESFKLKLENLRNKTEQMWSDIIVRNLRQTYPWLDESAQITFGNTPLAPEDEIVMNIMNLMSINLIDKEVALRKLVESNIISEQDMKEMMNRVTGGEQSMSMQMFGEKFSKGKLPKAYKEFKNHTEYLSEKLSDNDKRLLKQRMKRKGFPTGNMELVQSYDVGGIILSLWGDKEKWYTFIGSNLLQDASKETIMRKEMIDVLLAKKKELEASQKILSAADKDFHRIQDKLYMDVKQVFAGVVNNILSDIDKSKQKVEKVGLNDKIMSKINDALTGISGKINKLVENAFVKLGSSILVVDDGFDADKFNKEVRAKVQSRADIIKQNMKKQVNTTVNTMHNEISQIVGNGLAAGRSAADIKSEVINKFNAFKSKENPQDFIIERQILTMGTAANAVMKLQKWLAMYSKVDVIWDTVGDSKVRPEHIKMNRKVYDAETMLKEGTYPAGPNVPGGKWNCRCDIRIWDWG